MLRKKMFRDLKNNKVQFFSIFIMVFLGAFIYSGIGAEWYGIQSVRDEWYEKTNAGDVWLYGDTLDDALMRELSEMEDIRQFERRLSLQASIPKIEDAGLQVNFTEDMLISKADVRSGADFNADLDGIWLDEQFSNANHLKIGDLIELDFSFFTLELEIRGLVMSPDYVYMPGGNSFFRDSLKSGYAYIPYQELPEPVKGTYSDLLVDLHSEKRSDFIDAIKSNDSIRYSAAVSRDDLPGYSAIASEIIQHKTMATAFPAAFLLVAMLTVATAMTRLVSGQRTLIATLKALGFPKRKILFHYLSHIFFLSIVAAGTGAVAGAVTLSPLLFFPSMKKAYALPEWKIAIAPEFIYVPILLVFVCLFITFFVIRSFLKEKPALGMRPKVKNIHAGAVTRALASTGIRFSSRWNIRDISQNRMRSLMVMVGITGCFGLLLCAFASRDCILDLQEWQIDNMQGFESEIHLKKALPNEIIDEIKTEFDGELVMTAAVEIEFSGVKKTGELSAVEDVSQMSSFLNLDKKPVSIPDNGILMTYRMADLLGVNRGDTVRWHIYGKEEWIESRVTDLYYSPTTQGLVLSQSYLEKTGNQFIPEKIISRQHISESREEFTQIIRSEDAANSMKDTLEMMNLMIGVLILAAVILALVVLYCLGVISFTEKYRDMATLKVLGFKNRILRQMLFTQNLFLTLLSIPVGILFGYLLMKSLFADMTDSFDIRLSISAASFILCFVATLIITSLISILFSRRVKTVNMVEALKGAE